MDKICGTKLSALERFHCMWFEPRQLSCLSSSVGKSVRLAIAGVWARMRQFFLWKITVLGELCCVALSFCCVVLPCLLSEHLMIKSCMYSCSLAHGWINCADRVPDSVYSITCTKMRCSFSICVSTCVNVNYVCFLSLSDWSSLLHPLL